MECMILHQSPSKTWNDLQCTTLKMSLRHTYFTWKLLLWDVLLSRWRWWCHQGVILCPSSRISMSHTLCPEYKLLPSGRRCKASGRFKLSFIPTSVTLPSKKADYRSRYWLGSTVALIMYYLSWLYGAAVFMILLFFLYTYSYSR